MSGHQETNYVKIWGILLVLLAVSIIGPTFEILIVTLLTAFGVAIVKAGIVAKYFMHLGAEKKYVSYLLVLCVGLIVLLFVAVAPDVMKGEGTNWKLEPVDMNLAMGVSEHHK